MSKDQFLMDAVVRQRNDALNAVAQLQAELASTRLDLATASEELAKVRALVPDNATAED